MHILTLKPCPFRLGSVLQRNADVYGVEDTLVSCLDKIFRTSYGASLLPDYSVSSDSCLFYLGKPVVCIDLGV